jgi:hypothetical protein
MIQSLKNILTVLLTFTVFLHTVHGQDATKPDLKFDHILLFVSDHAIKDSIDQIFTPAEKLTTQHTNQGTIGYYYLFYNTYIELLFLDDSMKVNQNKANFGSDYLVRWSENPVAFGMAMTSWDTNGIKKDFHIYRSDDSPPEEYYLMSQYNNDPSRPLIYISQPHRAYQPLDSIEEVNQRPEEIREDLRKYLTHKNQVRGLTEILYSCADEKDNEGNMRILQESPSIEVKKSDLTSITLAFDGNKGERKAFMINDQTKLILEY